MTPQPRPKIIFFDIDETLYLNGEHRIPDSTVRALHRLKQQGIITAIATGRTPAVFPEAVNRLIRDTGIDTIVAVNGQYIRCQGRETGFPLRPEQISALSQHFAAHRTAYAAVSEKGIVVSGENDKLRTAMTALGLSYRQGIPEHTGRIYQMLAFYNREEAPIIEAGLPSDIQIIRWHENGVDLTAAEGSKARGIRTALDTLGIGINEAAAFGDGPNDYEMLQAVGFGIAMGNAETGLKAVADYTAPPAAEDGIYRALVELGILSAET